MHDVDSFKCFDCRYFWTAAADEYKDYAHLSEWATKELARIYYRDDEPVKHLRRV